MVVIPKSDCFNRRVNATDPPLYFLHIPKTAGTSVTAVLAAQFPPDKICPTHHLADFLALPREHLGHYELFRGHLFFGIERFLPRVPRYLTFLRDPIQRFLSNYQHIRRTPGHILNQRTQTLRDFLRDPEAKARTANFQTRSLGLSLGEKIEETVAQPQHGVLAILERSMSRVPEDQELFEIACQRLRQFHFVGITERFDESLSAMCAALGWELTGNPPFLNAAPAKLESEEVTDEAFELIREANQLDLKLYDYGNKFLASEIHANESEGQDRRHLERGTNAYR